MRVTRSIVLVSVLLLGGLAGGCTSGDDDPEGSPTSTAVPSPTGTVAATEPPAATPTEPPATPTQAPPVERIEIETSAAPLLSIPNDVVMPLTNTRDGAIVGLTEMLEGGEWAAVEDVAWIERRFLQASDSELARLPVLSRRDAVTVLGPPHAGQTRTGISEFDRVIDAVLTRDHESLVGALQIQEVPCAEPSGIGSPLPCPAGAPMGTPLPQIAVSSCEVGVVAPDQIAAQVDLFFSSDGAIGFHGIGLVELWENAPYELGDYLLLFQLGPRARAIGVSLDRSGEAPVGAVHLITGCDLSVASAYVRSDRDRGWVVEPPLPLALAEIGDRPQDALHRFLSHLIATVEDGARAEAARGEVADTAWEAFIEGYDDFSLILGLSQFATGDRSSDVPPIRYTVGLAKAEGDSATVNFTLEFGDTEANPIARSAQLERRVDGDWQSIAVSDAQPLP